MSTNTGNLWCRSIVPAESATIARFEALYPDGWTREQIDKYYASGNPVYVLEDGDHIIGYAALIVFPGKIAGIPRLAISPAWRRKGMGSSILKGIETRTKNVAPSLQVGVPMQNRSAVKFFQSELFCIASEYERGDELHYLMERRHDSSSV